MDPRLKKIIRTNQNNFFVRSRRKLLDILLSLLILKKREINILDSGTDTGMNIPILKKYGNVYAIDVNKKALVGAKIYSPKEVKLMDAINLEYPKGMFDIVCMTDVLEHIEDHKNAVLNIENVLKKGGYCIITVPAFNFLFSAHDYAVGHKRRYNPKELVRLFKNFKLIKIGFWNFIFSIPLSIRRLIKAKSVVKEVESVHYKESTNSILFSLLNFENRLIQKGFKFPFGLTIYAIFKK